MGLPAGELFTYSMLIPLAGLVGCLIAVATTDTIGRRTLCYIGAALATMFNALIGGIGSRPGANDSETDSNVVVASVILLNGVCKLGVASQCWLIGSEIGGTHMRNKLMGFGVVIDVLAAFLVTFFTPYLQDGPEVQLGARVGYVFMGLAAMSFFFFVFFTPELKGRSLEEVDELFEVRFTPSLVKTMTLMNYSGNCGLGNSARRRPMVSAPALLRWRAAIKMSRSPRASWRRTRHPVTSLLLKAKLVRRPVLRT